MGAGSLRCLRDYWNAVFRVRHEGRTYLLRVHSPLYHDARGVASELEWLLALRRDTELPVAQPIRDRRGKLVPVLDLPGLGRRACTLLSWVEGRRLARFGVPSYAKLGALTAELHAHAVSWKRPRGFVRPRWDASSFSRYVFQPHDERGWRGLPRATRRLFRSVIERVEGVERALSVTHPRAFGLVHADLHRGNVLATPRGLVPIDFDDSGFGCHLYDLAVTLTQELKSASSPHAAALIAGYRSVRPLDPELVLHLDTFVAARAVMVALFVRAWAKEDRRFAAGAEPVTRKMERFVRTL